MADGYAEIETVRDDPGNGMAAETADPPPEAAGPAVTETPDPASGSPAMEVVSVDELLERLTAEASEEEPDGADSPEPLAEAGEAPAGYAYYVTVEPLDFPESYITYEYSGGYVSVTLTEDFWESFAPGYTSEFRVALLGALDYSFTVNGRETSGFSVDAENYTVVLPFVEDGIYILSGDGTGIGLTAVLEMQLSITRTLVREPVEITGMDAVLLRLEAIETQVSHPLLTTPFEDYTVTEGLLLLALVLAVISLCIRMLKEGFSWL